MTKTLIFKAGLAILGLAVFAAAAAQSDKDKGFNGLGLGLGNLSRLSKAQTRSISPENFTGEKGKAAMSTDGPALSAARDLGQGWKVSPYVRVPAGETFVMADVKGEGAIQQIWLTPAGTWRFAILRIYWDGETEPSVECPVGDFFACGWGQYAQISSLPICVNPGSAFNCYWEMPFRKGFKVTIENIGAKPRAGEAPTANQFTVYYQINYTLTDVPDDAAYFHAQFRRVNPLPYKDVYTIVDGVKGWGHYVGTYLAWGVHNNGWWGEGEIKFYLDGDSKFPTIAGTGTEDYFCGSYDFDAKAPDGSVQYHEFTTPYTGLPQVIRGDGHYQVMQRFGLYRWHIMDPIRFEKNLKVTIQALGWQSGGRYLPLQDDIASVAFWYQAEPHAKFPKLPDKDYLEII
jgi:D-arabinan exo alpha-(1,3)/(1,5)-arabinofuranosidase (non-reducing end)